MSITVNASSTSTFHSTSTPAALTLAAAVSAGDLLVLAVFLYNGTINESVSTVSSSPARVWTKRKASTFVNGSHHADLEEWTAPSPGAIGASTLAVTVTTNNSVPNGSDCCMSVRSISGLNAASPSDPNASLPAVAQNATASSVAPSVSGVSTTNIDDVVFYFAGFASNATVTPTPSGFTSDCSFTEGAGPDFAGMSVGYEIVTGAQTNLTIASNATMWWILMADAFTADAAPFSHSQAAYCGA